MSLLSWIYDGCIRGKISSKSRLSLITEDLIMFWSLFCSLVCKRRYGGLLASVLVWVSSFWFHFFSYWMLPFLPVWVNDWPEGTWPNIQPILVDTWGFSAFLLPYLNTACNVCYDDPDESCKLRCVGLLIQLFFPTSVAGAEMKKAARYVTFLSHSLFSFLTKLPSVFNLNNRVQHHKCLWGENFQ